MNTRLRTWPEIWTVSRGLVAARLFRIWRRYRHDRRMCEQAGKHLLRLAMNTGANSLFDLVDAFEYARLRHLESSYRRRTGTLRGKPLPFEFDMFRSLRWCAEHSQNELRRGLYWTIAPLNKRAHAYFSG